MANVPTAVILAAGLGTRLLPATKSVPKEMLPIVDRPLVQYCVDEALAAGITEIVFVVAEGKGAIREHFEAGSRVERAVRETGNLKLADELLAIGAQATFHYVNQDRQLGIVLFAALRVRVSETNFREPEIIFARNEHKAYVQNRFWTGADLAASQDWVHPLDAGMVRELEAALASVKAQNIAWEQISRTNFPLHRTRLAGLLAEVADRLEHGRGLAKLTGVPVAGRDAAASRDSESETGGARLPARAAAD